MIMEVRGSCLWLGLLMLSAAAMMAAGCTSGTTTALVEPAERRVCSTVTLREGTFEGGEVSEESKGKIRTALMTRLYKAGAFREGPELTLTYRVTQYDAGSRSARYWSSGISGAGTLTMEVEYTDQAGRSLAKSVFTGKVSSGGFGGDFSGAIDAIANQIAAYTLTNFGPPTKPYEPGM
jgi:hypothetical protein